MEGRQVLVIEHDWRMRRLIRANLEAVGLVVREAVSLRHGLLLLQEAVPDLILLELDMPGIHGWHLLEELDARLSGRPVALIVMSAEPLDRWLRQHKLAQRHLVKPFAVSNLLQQVRGALENVEIEG